MPLKRSNYEVWLNIEGRELVNGLEPDHVVTVTHGDMLRAELEANKLRLPGHSEAPINAATLWVWAAMARLGLTQSDYRTWKRDELAELQALRDPATGTPLVSDVDPTQLAASTDSG